MRNRTAAEKYFEKTRVEEDDPFFVAYRSWIGAMEYLDCQGIEINHPAGTPLSEFVKFGEGTVTVDGKQYPASVIPKKWGLVVVLKDASLKEQFGEITGGLEAWGKLWQRFIAAILSIVTAFGGIFIFLGDFISFPKFGTKPANSRKDSQDLDGLLKILENEWPQIFLANNGFWYWGYYKNCSIRKSVAGVSIYKGNPLLPIEYRLTKEEGWFSVFEAHKQRKPYTVHRENLPVDNALAITMKDLGVKAVVTVPLERFKDGCPIGYLSTGLFLEPSPPDEAAIIESLKKVAALVEDWERQNGR